jgi:hypothetical protein
MTLYVDTSALLKRYHREHDSDVAVALMASDSVVVTSRLTEVEARRNLAQIFDSDDAVRWKRQLLEDLDAFALVSLDATTRHGSPNRPAVGPSMRFTSRLRGGLDRARPCSPSTFVRRKRHAPLA